MATSNCCHPPSMAIPRFATRKKATLRASNSVHRYNSHISIAATPTKMVFEDQVRGIVCYRDENGELICEGYDEGPRFGLRLPEKACFPWPVGVQVTDFIELTALRVFEDFDVLQIKNDDQRKQF